MHYLKKNLRIFIIASKKIIVIKVILLQSEISGIIYRFETALELFKIILQITCSLHN